MEDGKLYSERFNKEMKQLLASFERAREWEWSDLIKWLGRVRELLDKYSACQVPEKFTLSKRLAQCLNPALPQGLHYHTLKIYSKILKYKKKNDEPVDEDLALYSSGILPFFQYASPENKPVVLRIIEKFYVPLGRQLSFALPGIVTALLPGLEDMSNPEVVSKIYDILDQLAQNDRRGLYSAIWQALLRSARVRLGAIIYLSKKMPKPHSLPDDTLPQEDLIVNGLVASLNDESILVQRLILDFINSHFPLDSQVLNLKDKIAIMEAALYLIQKKDFTIMRRVWEWSFQGDQNPSEDHIFNLLEIMVPALNNIFGIHPAMKEEAIVPLKILEPLLEQEVLVEKLLMEISVTVLGYVERYKDDKELSKEIMHRCITPFSQLGEKRVGIWNALNNFLIEQLHGEALKALQIIKFYLDAFPLELQEAEYCKMVLNELLTYLHDLTQQTLTSGLQLARIIVKRLSEVDVKDLGEAVSTFHQFFVTMCRARDSAEQNLEDFKLAATLCIELEKLDNSLGDTEWVSCLIDLSRDARVDIALVSIECLLIMIKSPDEYPNIRQILTDRELEEDIQEIMLRLWTLLEDDYRSKAIEMAVMLHQNNPRIFTGTILNALNASGIDEQATSIKRFTALWKIIKLTEPEALSKIFVEGECIFAILDKLEHKTPLIRHNTREWLMASLSQFDVVLDPLFEALVPKKLRFINNNLVFREEYDIEQVLILYNRLKNIVITGEDYVFSTAKELKLSEKFENIDNADTYLDLMLDVSFKYIKAEADAENDKFAEMHKSVQATACEFIQLLVNRCDTSLAYKAVNSLLRCIDGALRNNDSVLQLLLLNILRVVIFNSRINIQEEKCIELFKSPLFADVYGQLLKCRDVFVRSHWIAFIVDSLQLMSSLISHPVLTKYLDQLLKTYLSLIPASEDKGKLLIGLRCLLHHSLKVLNPSDINDIRRELIEWQKPRLYNRNLSLDELPVIKNENIFANAITVTEVTNMIFSNLSKVIKTLIKCIGKCENPMKIKSRGLSSFKVIYEGQIVTDNYILSLLNPIVRVYPNEFIESAILLWIGLTLLNADPMPATDEVLVKLVSIMISLDVSPIVYLHSFNYYLRYKQQLFKINKKAGGETNQYEIGIAHLIYALLGSFKKSAFNFDVDQQKEFWSVFLQVLTELEYSPLATIPIWILELLKLGVMRVKLSECLIDRKLKKDLQDFVQRVYINVTIMCLAQGEDLKHPFPPSVFRINQEGVPSDLAGILVLKFTIVKVVSEVWKLEPYKVVSQLSVSAKLLLQDLTKGGNVTHSEIRTELIRKILEQGGTDLCNYFKKDIFDFLTHDKFFLCLKENKLALKNWCHLLNTIAVRCYEDRNVLIREMFGRIPSGLFVSKRNEIYQCSKIVKCIALLIYSGQIDDYQQCIHLLSERLIELLRSYEGELISEVLLCLRVFFYNLSPPVISEMWPRLWPHLLTELIQIFEKKEPISHMLAALKLLELLSAITNEEFHMYQWVFFFDYFNVEMNEEYNNEGFMPQVPKCLMPELGAKPSYERDGMETRGYPMKRGLVVTQTSVASLEELNRRALSLIDYILFHNIQRSEPDRESMQQVIDSDFLKS
jgi:hypothetical protein